MTNKASPLFLEVWLLRYSTTMPPNKDGESVSPQIQDQRPRTKWCLAAMPEINTSRWSAPVRILALTEDCIESAKQRGWTVLARDSDVIGVSGR